MNKLPDETLACIVSFLPWEDRACVVSTGNSRWKRAVANETLDMDLDSSAEGGTKDLNRALRFVARHCPLLESLSVRVPQSDFFREDDFEGQWFQPDDDDDSDEASGRLQLDGQTLAQAIEGCSSTLKRINLQFDVCCEEYTGPLIREADGLRCISQCSSLQILDCDYLRFDAMQQVVNILSPLTRSLVVLDLYCLDPEGPWNPGSPWQNTSLLAQTISEMPHLRRLGLHQQELSDNDIITMLGPHSRELRYLDLSGQFGESTRNPMPGFLTDTTMHHIAQYCPKLQSLHVSCNRLITHEGIKEVLEACPLRELTAFTCDVPVSKWKEFVIISSTLFIVTWGLPVVGDPFVTPEDLNELEQAIVACGGRTVFTDPIKGLFEPDIGKVGREALERQKETIALLDRLAEKMSSNNIEPFNEWEEFL